ncbi:MAG: phosphotransferase [Aurantimicrobium sp.]|nr:phosphotransferase [Aurantimicrobium sp.]
MARSQFTLAALVVSAVPDFDPARVTPVTSGIDADFESALVTDPTGRAVIVRLPTSRATEQALTHELRALEILTAGVRSRLGFELPNVCGRAPMGNTFGLVFDLLPGDVLQMGDIMAGTFVPAALGRAIASIHELPANLVSDAGLSYVSATAAQQRAREIVERAAATNMLPDALETRWSRAVVDSKIWQFDPTVIHGSLGVGNFLVGEDSVSAVQGWGTLHVGDPALDLMWLTNADESAGDEAFHAYQQVRLSSADPNVRRRAVLYSELEIAKWLLHGVRERNTEIVEDANDMMERLVATIGEEPVNTVGVGTEPIMTVNDVEHMLDVRPPASH